MAIPQTLQKACFNGKANGVKRQLQRMSRNYNECYLQKILTGSYSQDVNTPLTPAATPGNKRSPLTPAATPGNHGNRRSLPIFHHSCLKGHAEVIKVFLEYMTNETLYELMMIEGPEEDVPFFYTLCSADSREVITALVRRLKYMDSCSIHNMCSIKHIQHGHHGCMAYFGTAMHAAISKDGDCTSVFDILRGLSNGHLYKVLLARDFNGHTPLHLACLMGKADVVRMLLRYLDREQLLTLKDSRNNTTLHLAVHRNSFDIVSAIMGRSKGTKHMYNMLSTMNTDHKTPLHIAVGAHHVYLGKALLRGLGDEELFCLLSHVMTIHHKHIHDGMFNGYTSGYISLRCHVDSSPRVQSETDLGVVAMLIDTLKHLDARTLRGRLLSDVKCGSRVLHLAIREGYTCVLELLRSLEIEDLHTMLSVEDHEGQTLLHLACQTGQLDAIRILLDLPSLKGNHLRQRLLFRDSNGDTPLHIAIRNGYSDIALVILKHCEDVYICDLMLVLGNNGDNLIDMAIKGRLSHVVKTLFKQCNNHLLYYDVFASDGSSNTLHLAASSGCLDIVKLIVKHLNKDNVKLTKMIQEKNSQNKTPLDIAVNETFSDIAEALLKILKSDDVYQFLMMESDKSYRKVSVLDAVMCTECADSHNPITEPAYFHPLSCFYRAIGTKEHFQTEKHCAACQESANKKLVEVLLKYATKLRSEQLKNLLLNGRLSVGSSLHFALKQGHTCVLKLLECLDSDNLHSVLQAQDCDGRTLFQLACFRGQLHVVRAILDVEKLEHRTVGAMLAELDIECITALRLACLGGCTNVVNTLFEHADGKQQLETLELGEKDLQLLLHKAISDGCSNVVRSVLEKCDSHRLRDILKQVQSNDMTSLHTAVTNQHADVIDLLLDKLTSEHLCDILMIHHEVYGSALNEAIYQEYTEIAMGVIEHLDENASQIFKLLTVKDIDNDSSLHLAIKAGDLAVVRGLLSKFQGILLYEYCATKDCEGNTPLCIAIVEANPQIINVLLSTLNCDQLVNLLQIRNDDSDTALHISLKDNDSSIINAVIDRCCVEDIFDLLMMQDKKGDTALHVAIREGDTNIVEPLLILFNNNQLHDLLTIEGQNELTLLQAAARINHAYLVYSLLEFHYRSEPYEVNECLG